VQKNLKRAPIVGNRRETDGGFLCIVALRARQFWDFIDRRDIDKHLLSIGIFYGTVKVTMWAMAFADSMDGKPGLEVAAIIGAVCAPYMALQAAAISFYFKARGGAHGN
jgi:hypothetical protein